jgi:hypothetical protein
MECYASCCCEQERADQNADLNNARQVDDWQALDDPAVVLDGDRGGPLPEQPDPTER